MRNPPFVTLGQVTKTSAPLPGFQSTNHANSQQKDELQEGWRPLLEFGRFFLSISCYAWGRGGSQKFPEDGEENQGL